MNKFALLSIGAIVLIPVILLIIGYVLTKLKQSQLIVPKHIFYVAALVYAASLYFPVWSVERNTPIMGYEALMMGWLALFIFDPRWFCNIVVLLSAICVFRSKNSKCQSYCFLLAAIGSTCIFGPYHAGLQTGTMNLFEGTGLALGGYLWILSLWLFSISAYLRK